MALAYAAGCRIPFSNSRYIGQTVGPGIVHVVREPALEPALNRSLERVVAGTPDALAIIDNDSWQGRKWVCPPRICLLVDGNQLRYPRTAVTHIRSEERRLNSSHLAISYAVFCL